MQEAPGTPGASQGHGPPRRSEHATPHGHHTCISVTAGGTCGSGRPALIKTLAGLRLKDSPVIPVSLCSTVGETSLATRLTLA